MVDVVSPDFPIKGIKLIIVKRNGRAGLVDLWPDHWPYRLMGPVWGLPG
jgi:hypothetical protein